MRRLKLFFACLLMAVLSIGQVWGASPATLSFSAACGGSGTDSDGNSWTISSDGSESSFDNTKGIHYGTSSAQVKYIRLTTSGITGTITQVVVNASTASGVSATAAVKVGTTDFTIGSQASTTASLTSSAANYTFTGSASGSILVEITKPSKAAKAIYCKSVSVTYTTGGVVNVASVSLDESAITLTIDGEEQKTLTATVLPENATNKNVTWESDDEDIATVEDGVVTAVGAGDATITCKSVADNTKYAECTVHVNPSQYSKSRLIFEAAYGTNGATADDGAEWTVTSDATESVYDATSGIHYGTGSASVTYLQLATSDIDGQITKVVVNARDAQANATISVTVGGTAFTCAESTTATNTSTNYTFTGTGEGEIIVRIERSESMVKAIYCKSIVVSYVSDGKEAAGLSYAAADAQKLAKLGAEFTAPTLSNDNNLAVTYASGDEDVVKVNASTGAITEIVAAGKAVITASTEGDATHKAGSASYTIFVAEQAGTAEDPLTEASAKALIDLGCTMSAHVKGTVNNVGNLNTKYGSITLTLAGGLQYYGMLDVNGVQFESNPFIEGDVVTAVGNLKKHNSTYELDLNCQLVERIPFEGSKTSIANDQASAYTVAQALVYAADGVTYDLNDEVYVRGKVAIASTSLFSSKYLTYSISDDGTTENVLKVYNGLGIGGADFESKDDILVGEVVIVKGKLTQHNTELELAANNELVSKKPVATIAIENMELEFAEEAAISATITPAAAASTVVYNIKAGSDDVITLAVDQITAKSVAGTATIVATIDATDDYEGATKEFTVTVVEPAAPAEPAELPFSFTGGSADITNTQGMSQEGLGSDYTSGNPTTKLKFDGTGDYVIINIASNPGKLTYDIIGNGFSDGTFKVQESANGTDYTDVVAYTELGAKSSEEKNLAQETRFVKFIYTEKSSGNVGLGNIEIAAYVAPAAVAEPTFTPVAGAYIGAQNVTLACATDGATIYYTTNGDDPTASSTEYTAPFELNATATVKAIAIKGSDVSSVASATYTIVTLEHAGTVDDPYTVADARTAIDAGVGVANVYATGIVSEIVTAYNSQFHNISYNISADGLTTSDQLQAFRGKDKDGANFTSADDVQVGDEVVVYGNLTKYGETYEFGQDNQRYSFTRPGDPVLLSIAISEDPTKTTYDVGDVFDVTGLVVTGTYDQGDPAAIASGITWEVRTNSTSEAVALGSYTLALNQTALQVRATVSAIASEWYDVTGLTVQEHEITPGAYDIVPNNTFFSTEANGSITGEAASLTYTGTQNDITITYAKGTQSNMYINAAQTRVYNGSVMGFSVPAGYVIKAIAFTADGNNWAGTHTASEGSMTDNKNWSGTANSVTITFGGTCRISSIKVTFEEYVPATIATPTFSLAAGEYDEAKSVELSCETEGATIYYTTDGNDPDNTKTQYTGAISVSESMTIKAIAYKDAEYSEVATAAYTINLPEEQDDVTGTWTLVTDLAQIGNGKKVIIAEYVVADGALKTMAAQSSNGNNRTAIESSVTGSTLTPAEGTKVFTLVEGASSTYYLQTSDGKYIYNASTSNKSYLKTKDDQDASWTISVSAAGVATINSVENTNRTQMMYNSNNDLFNCYGSGQSDIALYVLEESTPEPQYTDIRTGLSAGNYYTVCWPKAMTAIKGGTLWSFAGKDANMAYLIQEDAPFEAGKPYIIYATAEKLEAVVEGDDAAAGSNNGLYGTLDYMDAAALSTAGATHMLKNNELRPIGTNNHLDAQRAYVILDDIQGGAPTNAPAHKVRAIPMQKDAATGIEDVQGDNVQSTKVLIDGQLFILRGEKMYNANGQLVK